MLIKLNLPKLLSYAKTYFLQVNFVVLMLYFVFPLMRLKNQWIVEAASSSKSIRTSRYQESRPYSMSQWQVTFKEYLDVNRLV